MDVFVIILLLLLLFYICLFESPEVTLSGWLGYKPTINNK